MKLGIATMVLLVCAGCARPATVLPPTVPVPALAPSHGMFDMRPCGHEMEIHADYALVELSPAETRAIASIAVGKDLGSLPVSGAKVEVKGANFQIKEERWCSNGE